MIDRMLMLAMAPISLAGGAFGLAVSGPDQPRTTATESAEAIGQHMVRRAADGLFHVRLTIDGKSADMIVDTGATTSVLSARQARMLGLRVSGKGGTMVTAGGSSRYRLAHGRNARVGAVQLGSVDFAVVDASMPHGLLGQDALERIEHLSISDDQLTLR